MRLSTCEDAHLIDHMHLQWQDALDIESTMQRWLEENATGEFSDWYPASRAFQEKQGMPGYFDPGRLSHNKAIGTWTLKLRAPIRDSFTGEVLHGDRLTKCSHCGELFLTFNHRERHCSDECKVAAVSTKKERKAAARKTKLTARRDALASRKGLCLVCGTEFDLKRITSRTCSAKCRQRLHRDPDSIQQVALPGPQTVDLDFPELLPILRKQRNELAVAELAASIAAIQTGQESDHDRLRELDELDARLAEEEHSWALHRLYAESPALAAWILKQPEQVQRDATGYGEAAIKLLGPDLYKRLSESR